MLSRLFDTRNHRLHLIHVIALALLLPAGCASRENSSAGKVALFNGQGMTGWRAPVGDWRAVGSVALAPGDRHKFTFTRGLGTLLNGTTGRTVNAVTEVEHGDAEAHIEFCVPEGSNSGVYFQGRYEVQILDSWGVAHPKYGDCGGLYQRWRGNQGFEGRAPDVNASKPPGEWQTFHVLFRAPRFDASGRKTENARFVRVTHNGRVIHENAEVTGPTRSAVYETDEKPLGPLMLQGDHGPVAYRNLWLRPARFP